MTQKILNYINGEWQESSNSAVFEVRNPANQEVLATVPLSSSMEVEAAIAAAAAALPAWRDTSPVERVQYLFKLKVMLEEQREELARLITCECGKTLDEARGELQRAIENVEMACGIPMLLQGVISEDIAPGIDEMMLRQPVGVCATIAPFNFPAMIPFWFFPYAIACGNTYLIKPSERVPMTMQRIFQLLDQLHLPPGVINLINGDKAAVDVLLDHPQVRAISFVGSTHVARYVYSRAASNGKRAQCQGGAKNPVVIMPDADLEMTTKIIADSAFGCAGQRCLAAAMAITVGEARDSFTRAIVEAAATRKVGFGLNEGIQMGPVISPESLARIEALIDQGLREGGKPLVDGRKPAISGYESGNFLRPTVLSEIHPDGVIATTEIFGPVLGLMHVDTLEQAIDLVNRNRFGNMACLFTNSGADARKFRHDADAGNIGINIGVAAPMAFFPFSGWKDSFFGDLHGQAQDAIDFFTQKKVVVERWPKIWSRKF